MRKLKLQMQMTIDGFVAGQNGEMKVFRLFRRLSNKD